MINIRENISKAIKILKVLNYNFIPLFILILINSFSELLTISLIAPFLITIFDSSGNSLVNESRIISFLLENLNQKLIISALLITIILKSIISIILEKKILIIGVNLKDRLRRAYFKKISENTYEAFMTKDASHYTQLINNLINKFIGELMRFFQFLVELFKVLFLLFFIASIDLHTISVIFVIFIIYVFLFDKNFKKKLSIIGKIENENYKLSFRHINEFTRGIKELVVFEKINEFILKIISTSFKANSFDIKRQFINVISKNLIEPFVVLLIISIYFHNSLIKGMSISDNVIFIILFFYVLLRLKPFLLNSNQIFSVLRYMEDTISEISKDLFIKNNKINELNEKLIKGIEFEKIQINDLFYGYDKKRILFKNFNLIIQPGDIIGIYGQSGSGKSTFFNILSGLLHYEKKNDIKIFPKRNIDNSKYLKSLVGYIPQNPFFFTGSIYENISLKAKINKTEIKKINNLIQNFNLNHILEYESDLTFQESSSTLSGGELQRLAILRSIYFNKKIILIDEGLNSLDKKNLSLVYNTITNLSIKKSITFLIISHNKKHFMHTNKIINFDEFT